VLVKIFAPNALILGISGEQSIDFKIPMFGYHDRDIAIGNWAATELAMDKLHFVYYYCLAHNNHE
jgi:hypothetical protein